VRCAGGWPAGKLDTRRRFPDDAYAFAGSDYQRRRGLRQGVTLSLWVPAIAITLALVAALGVLGARAHHERRAVFLGVATGMGFGFTVMVAAVTAAYAAGGVGGVFISWQTWLLIVLGPMFFVSLQKTMAAGRLAASQRALTLSNPIVAVGFGVAVFGEHVRGGGVGCRRGLRRRAGHREHRGAGSVPAAARPPGGGDQPLRHPNPEPRLVSHDRRRPERARCVRKAGQDEPVDPAALGGREQVPGQRRHHGSRYRDDKTEREPGQQQHQIRVGRPADPHRDRPHHDGHDQQVGAVDPVGERPARQGGDGADPGGHRASGCSSRSSSRATGSAGLTHRFSAGQWHAVETGLGDVDQQPDLGVTEIQRRLQLRGDRTDRGLVRRVQPQHARQQHHHPQPGDPADQRTQPVGHVPA